MYKTDLFGTIVEVSLKSRKTSTDIVPSLETISRWISYFKLQLNLVTTVMFLISKNILSLF